MSKFVDRNINSFKFFDLHLPPEIIHHILQFLSAQDLLMLGIAKIFLPHIIQQPVFMNKVNKLMLHLLCQSYTEKLSLFINCSIIPIIINQNFCFGIDLYNTRQLRKAIFAFNTHVKLFWHTLSLFSLLLDPFQCFISWQKETQFSFSSYNNFYSPCSSQCNCTYYRFQRVEPNKYKRECYVDNFLQFLSLYV